MKDFKTSRPKAAVAAARQVTYDQSEKIVAVLAVLYPKFLPLLMGVQASFGMKLAYQQEKLNQFTQFLSDNQDIFRRPMIETKEFRDGLIVFLESYFKLRSDEKLRLAQNVFLDFSKDLKKPLYPLERYDDTLEKISQTGLHFLGFIQSELPKLKLEYTESEVEKFKDQPGYQKVLEDEGMDGLVESFCGPKSLNFFIEQHINKLAYHKMKDFKDESIQRIERESEIKNNLQEPFSLVQSELEQLGLAKGQTRAGGWGPGEYHYNLTDYGKKFVSVIKPEDIY